MVDGSMNLSMPPETNRSDGGNLRRISMGKASSLSIDEQSSSRDRRSSSGSCHDLCKYGHKHSLEVKVKDPLLKKAMKKPHDAQNSNQAVVVLEKEKYSVPVTKSKASPSSRTCISGSTDVVKQVVPINSPSRRSLVESELMSKTEERVMPVKSPSRQSSLEIEVTSESKEVVVPVNSPSKKSPVEMEVISESKELVVPMNSPSRQSAVKIEFSSESKEREVPENSPSRPSSVEIEVRSKSMERVALGVTSESKEPVMPKSSPSRQSPYKRSPLKSEVMNESKELVAKTKTMPITQKPKIHKNGKVVSSSTKSESSRKPALTSIGEAGGDSFSKPKALKAKSVTSFGSSRNIAVHRNNSSKSGEGTGSSKGHGTKVVGDSTATSDPNSVDAMVNLPTINNKNSKVVSQVISQNKSRRVQTKGASNAESQEKTLYVINMETKKTKVVESDKNEKHGLKGYPKSPSSPYKLKPSSLANEPSRSPLREDRGGTKHTSEANATFSGLKKHSNMKKEDDHNGVRKGRPPTTLQTKGKNSSFFNLSLRNRKVVDLHSKRHGPMKLKFTQGKSLGDNPKDGQRTTLKKGVVKGISKNSAPPSEKVVLRHQDVQGKKDSQVLFNNVIAETARKLGRTRKSKVKALVGAFEKVISLQDKKPSLRATT